jgi:SAM-dependent methyltransferase
MDEGTAAGRRFGERYLTGEHLAKNPGWHAHESAWKAGHVVRMLARNGLAPKRIGDVGCGAGEVLRLLQARLPADCEFWGYDVSPQALALCAGRGNARLHFRLADPTREAGAAPFDLLLVLDVVEHVEDCFGFLRALRPRGRRAIFEVPLDLSVQTVLRGRPLLRERDHSGHLHYFTKDLALQLLRDVGYEVRDHFYTAAALDFRSPSLRNRLPRAPRRLLGAVHEDFAVRLLGGYRLMVLAE